MDVQHFKNPPKEYGELPFWGWNDVIEIEELKRQIALFDEAGCTGFLVNARIGLRTSYLGQEWMKYMRAAVEEAKKRGLRVWIYDEDQWPSGYAGGLSVASHPEYRAQYLVCKVDNRPAFMKERVGTFSATEIDGQLTNIHFEEHPQLKNHTDRMIQFYPQGMPLGSGWFRDYAYLDILNPEAAKKFIECTYEAYAEVIGDEFGDTVAGVFTVEPSFMSGYDVICGHVGVQQPAIPWTKGFAQHFEETNGYDLIPHLPSLFFDVGEYHHIRYDYWRTITKLFVENFTRQAYDWCDSHNLYLSGHYMAEDTLQSQIRWSGAIMPHYAWLHIPGMDKLGREIYIGYGTPLTFKQMDSIVCQLGKTRGLCWNFGCMGYDFALEGRKWIGNWAYVLGVNLNAPSLSLYGMRGENKRDYPPHGFYQNPWWSDIRLISDYIARLSYVLSKGQRVIDILIIHPIGSAWTAFKPGATYAVDQLDQPFARLLMSLLCGQRDFHLGDEMLMEPGAPAEASVRLDETGPRIDVGKMSYRVIIVPPAITLTENTIRLLKEFADLGGAILAFKPIPDMINGRPMDESVLPASTRIVTIDSLHAVLDSQLPFDVRVPGRPSIWAHHRKIDDDCHCYFLAESDSESGGPATVQIRGTGHLEAWDPVSGDVHPLSNRQKDGITEAVLDFPPAGSHLLMLHRDQSPAEIAPQTERLVAEFRLDDSWRLSLDTPNSLTLDTAQVCIGEDGSWSPPMHILDAHAFVAKSGYGTPFSVRFTFDADIKPADPAYLVLEKPKRFEIMINGKRVPNTDVGWWRDIFFRKVEISAAIEAGQNEISLNGTFTRDTELESVYVIGRFGVRGRRLYRENKLNGQIFDRYTPEFRIIELPKEIGRNTFTDDIAIDMTSQGFPFFAGRVKLQQRVVLPQGGNRVLLEIDTLRAAVAHVYINGKDMGPIAWKPYSININEGLQAGENEIEIELASSIRNLLGPHHLAGGDLAWTSPEEFRDKSRWACDYILVPFGFDGIRVKVFQSQ